MQLAEDKDTVAFFSVVPSPQSSDDPVKCWYFDYYAFRRDGRMIHWTFNYAD